MNHPLVSNDGIGKQQHFPTVQNAATMAEICPPTILKGLEATECGTKNTIATELAMAATTVPFVIASSATSIPTRASPANSACTM